MVVFHFARDLEIFGILPPGTTLSGGWHVLARVVAGSFFFFAGMSLVLAHGERIRWRSFSIGKKRDADINDIIWNLNSAPRNCLGYRTHVEAFAADLAVTLQL